MLDILRYSPLLFIEIFAIVVFSITIHELAHGFAAISQGDDTPIRKGHMTFNPVVHMGWQAIIVLCLIGVAWGQMPVNPYKFRDSRWGHVIVAAAGPLANLGLALMFYLFGLIGHSILGGSGQFAFNNLSSDYCSLMHFFGLAISMSISLCLLNLLPIPPLDGFYVFREIFPDLQSLERLTHKAEWPIIFLLLFFLGSSLWSSLGSVIYGMNPFMSIC